MIPRNLFTPGRHRPVYLWAGAGTVRMNRLKFMDAPVDEAVHLEAQNPTGARRMAEEAGFNWAYLTYDWGFPPEIEKEDGLIGLPDLDHVVVDREIVGVILEPLHDLAPAVRLAVADVVQLWTRMRCFTENIETGVGARPTIFG